MVERLKNSLRNNLKNYFSNGPKAIFVVLMILMITTIMICSLRKTVVVSIDGKNTTITTFRKTYRAALAANNIQVGPKDKTTPSLENVVKNNSKVSIKKAVNVEVHVDGKVLNIQSAEDTVEAMLKAEGIAVNDYDKVVPSMNDYLENGIKVAVTRVESKVINETLPIDYATVVQKNNGLEQGKNQVMQNGVLGKKEVSTRVILEDGKEVSRKVISETIIKQPVSKVISMGTLGVYNPSRGGRVLYTRSIRMRATAYCSGSYTYSGTRVRRNSDGYSSVAVDPRVIPLGTRLYVEGYGYAIAEDIGSAIKGNDIDLFFDSRSETNNWGVRYVSVYLIK